MVHEKLLTEAGLTQNEAIVYLTLLKIGKSQSGRIVKEAKISGGKIYETLYKLIEKGLAEVVVENGVKQFCAASPQSLLLYMKEREHKIIEQSERLEKIVPELEKIRTMEGHLENVYLIKGFRGIKPIVYDAINTAKKDFLIMGVRSSKKEAFNTFWRHWHNERVSNKKDAKMLFTDKNTDYWKFFKKLGNTEIKSTPSLSPSAIMTVDNQTFIFSYEEELTCIHIISKSVAKSFRSFFEGLWMIGEK